MIFLKIEAYIHSLNDIICNSFNLIIEEEDRHNSVKKLLSKKTSSEMKPMNIAKHLIIS